MAEGGLRARKEGVQVIRGRHRSGCLEMRILPLVTAMIARSSRAWRWLPQAAVPEYTTWRTKVKKWSTIRVTNKTYSVPSRLCGHEVKVHQYADYLEVYYKDHMVERLERVRGEHKSRIDYRHIIWSLVRRLWGRVGEAVVQLAARLLEIGGSLSEQATCLTEEVPFGYTSSTGSKQRTHTSSLPVASTESAEGSGA